MLIKVVSDILGVMIKPSRLSKGDTIALVSPSSSLAAVFPHRLDQAVKALESLGYNTKEYPSTRQNATPEEKASDLMDAFGDPSVKAIICTIGGYNSNKLIRHLDMDVVKSNPTIFCGYSDISVLHYIFHKAGLVTFYGPAAITQLGEFPKPLSYSMDYFLKAVTGVIGTVSPSAEWTEEFLDWSTKEDQKRARNMAANKGFEWLSEGSAKGDIIGGCIPSIMHLRGTEFWPSYDRKIVFLEIPEGESPSKGLSFAKVESYLTDFEYSGMFTEASALVFGRPYAYSESDIKKLKDVLTVIGKEYSIPVLFGADIGHTDPMITIPLGVEAAIDSERNSFEISESGVV